MSFSLPEQLLRQWVTTFRLVLWGALVLSPPVGLIAGAADPQTMPPVRLSEDGSHFVLGDSGETFTPWGFNYVGSEDQILEEYWEEDWPRVEADFREMKELGANVVRVHLQVGTYMESPETVNKDELKRLKKLLDLARETGLYLDLTGLGCYHPANMPEWYPKLSEQERWDVQARFWEAIAKTCEGHPAVFCYDLMNEPVITGIKKDSEHPWLAGELGGFYFVQTIVADAGERTQREIAAAWVKKLTTAIGKHDSDHLVTVGIIPWALVWPTAEPIFYAKKPAQYLDFASVHFYPKSGEIDKAIKALAVYDIGKPLVVEETFPLSCSIEELDQFIDGGDEIVEGWISHYFGQTIAEHEAAKDSLTDAISADFLAYWREKGREVLQ